jgi:hypothetical protein
VYVGVLRRLEHPDRTNPNASAITSIPEINKLSFFIKVLFKQSKYPLLRRDIKRGPDALEEGLVSRYTPKSIWLYPGNDLVLPRPPFSGFLLFQSGAGTPVKPVFLPLSPAGRPVFRRQKEKFPQNIIRPRKRIVKRQRA